MDRVRTTAQNLGLERSRKNLAAFDKMLAGKLSPADLALTVKLRAKQAANVRYRQKLTPK
jgi:hypothetical protein